MNLLQDIWQQLIVDIDRELNGYLDQLSQACPDRLRSAMRYSLLAPGKRLRPILCLLASDAFGGARKDAMPAACSLEMIHCYSLIHDDLPAMDDDDLRRGAPTCHVKFDEATAILAGDALQALAFDIVARNTKPAEIAMAISCLLSQAAGPEGMVGGQSDDLMAETTGGDADFLASIHRRKTGAMILAACQIGAKIGRASSTELSAMATYGRAIGLAFQIVDDLLDVESSLETVGKRTGKDFERGKLTYPGFHGIESSRQRVAELISESKQAVHFLGNRGDLLVAVSDYIAGRSF